MKLGDLTLRLFDGGSFKLDGGAMHGVVPKTIWSRLVSCDDKNRCSYATNCLYAEVGGKRVLVETGNGDKFSPKEKDIYGIDHDCSIEKVLRQEGIEASSIDYVIMTHLHFDHSGGTTRANGAPVFPRAKHVIQARELHDATHPHERNRASYLPENFQPLRDAGLLLEVDGETELAPGIRVLPTPGHTRGHQSVLLSDGNGHQVVFFGDVIPTAVHLKLPFIMAYDLDVVGTLESKRALLPRIEAEHILAVFGHEQVTRAGYLVKDDKGNFTVGDPVAI